MFTFNQARLSDFTGLPGVDLRRDCAFRFVGKIPTNLEHRLVFASKPVHVREIKKEHGIAGVIAAPEIAEQIPEEMGLLISEKPVKVAMDIHDQLVAKPDFLWSDHPSTISASADIHPSAVIADKNVTIGDNVTIGAQTVVHERVVIGNGSSIGASCVIGSDAFEARPGSDIRRVITQAGGVRIGKHVTVQAGTTIDRSTFGGFTEIGDETMIDNLVQVGHDCRLGQRCTITAKVELSGRVTLGDDVYIGPNACISNGLTVGDKGYVTIGSVVIRNVAAGERVSGNFAVPHHYWSKFIAGLITPKPAK